jgi:hypothetical protein
MATSTFNAQEIETRRKLLHEELAVLEEEKKKQLGGMQVIDYHHPERTPGWPIYNLNDPRNKYPQLLYHPTEKDRRIEEVRLGIRRRNEANPTLAPMEVPPSECVTKKVGSVEEKKAALAAGFVETPPQRQMIDDNSPAALIGRPRENPLLADMARQVREEEAAKPKLSVETILKLNAMPKDELIKVAENTYGVILPDESSKVDIISAIQNKA